MKKEITKKVEKVYISKRIFSDDNIKKTESALTNLDDYIELANDISDYLNDKEWSAKLVKKGHSKVKSFSDLLSYDYDLRLFN